MCLEGALQCVTVGCSRLQSELLSCEFTHRFRSADVFRRTSSVSKNIFCLCFCVCMGRLLIELFHK